MDNYYTKEINTQILISLMKAHGIKKIVISPGTTNICFVASVQQDPYFEIYSSVDERSAAYIACGLATESGKPVALSCTGATASRNYIPGLTEAFYRKLPVLAITSALHDGRIGQNMPQIIDRRSVLNDIVKISVQAPIAYTEEDKWALTVKINQALLELYRKGGGPVHINLMTTENRDFSQRKLPYVNVIRRITYGDVLPKIPKGRIAIFVGAHSRWGQELTNAVDDFCEKYNGVVLCDQTSNYRGKYRILINLISSQAQYNSPLLKADLMIDIGDISGSYMPCWAKQVWRVNPDGEVRDRYKKLCNVFEMKEVDFFQAYADQSTKVSDIEYYHACEAERKRIAKKIPELPFSNVWVAQQTADKLLPNSVLYLGILNSLRSWNFFETPSSVTCYSNTGGFGIDGGVSTLLGISLADKKKLCFGIVGDLGFFYDMNVLGNRYVGKNIRLMIINNGRGTEFRNYNHFAARFGENADLFMAAAGHYGKKSPALVKHYANDLGFEYLSASTKTEYLECIDKFLQPGITDRSIIFEVFTDSQNESDAVKIMNNLEVSSKGYTKKVVMDILGDKAVQRIKDILK